MVPSFNLTIKKREKGDLAGLSHKDRVYTYRYLTIS
jgi:hypothetical protein